MGTPLRHGSARKAWAVQRAQPRDVAARPSGSARGPRIVQKVSGCSRLPLWLALVVQGDRSRRQVLDRGRTKEGGEARTSSWDGVRWPLRLRSPLLAGGRGLLWPITVSPRRGVRGAASFRDLRRETHGRDAVLPKHCCVDHL